MLERNLYDYFRITGAIWTLGGISYTTYKATRPFSLTDRPTDSLTRSPIQMYGFDLKPLEGSERFPHLSYSVVGD